MSSTEAVTNFQDRGTSSLNNPEDTENEEINVAIKKILVSLSESKRSYLEKKEYTAIKDMHLKMVSKGQRNNKLSGLTSSMMWHEFVKMLLARFLIKPKDGANENKRSRGIGENQCKLFVKMILKDCAPAVDLKVLTNHIQITSNLTNTYNLSVLLSCLFHNCSDKDEHDQTTNIVMKLAQNPNISSKIHRLCICLICSLENQTFFLESVREISVDCLDVVAKKLCNWLVNVSSHQTISTPQEKMKPTSMKKIIVQEIDGTPSRDIFTILNIASAYKTEHMNNIYSFSILQSWLIILQKYDTEIWDTIIRKVSKTTRAATAIPRLVGQSSFYLASSASSGSSGPTSLSSSLSSLNSFLFVENESDKSKDLDCSPRTTNDTPPLPTAFGTPPSLYESVSLHSNFSLRRPMSVSTPKKNTEAELSLGGRKPSAASLTSGGLTLKNACIRYCFRVLNQAERSPKKLEDKRMLESTIIEAMRILTILCQQDKALLKKVFPEMKRVHLRFLGKSIDARRLYPADIQFFVEHFDSMLYNTEELVHLYLNNAPAQLYTNSIACFEILEFCLRNASFLQRFPFLSRFFPNLLKIIAWHPRSFIYEFLQLMPLFMTQGTTGEVFHSILDIPCTSAMLELTQQKKIDQFLVENLEASFGESGAFISKSHRAISDFFMRSESGGAETIDKLDKIFIILAPLSNRTRITVCCQIVPILLQKFFQCLISLSNSDTQRQLFPSMLERLFVLFPNATLHKGVRSILSQQLIQLCSLNPVILSVHQDEILHVFKQMRTSCSGLEPVLSSLIYCIGEYSIRPGICSMEQIAKYYEVIETLLYETKASLFVVNEFPINAKLLSSLISTAGKLAAFSQDFVPKTVICLSKLVNTEWRLDSCRITQREFEIVMSRASDIVNVLRLPNVSPAVLCSAADLEPWHLNKDSSLQLKIHAMARRQTTGTDTN